MGRGTAYRRRNAEVYPKRPPRMAHFGAGWLKSVGGFRRTRYRGLAHTQLAGHLVATACNLVRMARMVAEPVAT